MKIVKKSEEKIGEKVDLDKLINNELDKVQTHHLLTEVIAQILDTNEKNPNTMNGIINSYIDTDDEEEVEEAFAYFGDRIIGMLKHIGVADATIEDLIGDDEEVSVSELILLAENLAEKVKGDPSKFIFKIITDTVDEDGITMDNILFDNTFYGDKGECVAGRGEDNGVAKLKPYVGCIQGFSNGVKGWWRRPITNAGKNGTNNANLVARERANSKRKASPAEKKALQKARLKAHTGKAEQKREKSMNKRSKAGMNVFGGYVTSGKKRDIGNM